MTPIGCSKRQATHHAAAAGAHLVVAQRCSVLLLTIEAYREVAGQCVVEPQARVAHSRRKNGRVTGKLRET